MNIYALHLDLTFSLRTVMRPLQPGMSVTGIKLTDLFQTNLKATNAVAPTNLCPAFQHGRFVERTSNSTFGHWNPAQNLSVSACLSFCLSLPASPSCKYAMVNVTHFQGKGEEPDLVPSCYRDSKPQAFGSLFVLTPLALGITCPVSLSMGSRWWSLQVFLLILEQYSIFCSSASNKLRCEAPRESRNSRVLLGNS